MEYWLIDWWCSILRPFGVVLSYWVESCRYIISDGNLDLKKRIEWRTKWHIGLFGLMISLRRLFTGLATLSLVWRLYWMEKELVGIYYGNNLLMHQIDGKLDMEVDYSRKNWIWIWIDWKKRNWVEIWIEKDWRDWGQLGECFNRKDNLHIFTLFLFCFCMKNFQKNGKEGRVIGWLYDFYF